MARDDRDAGQGGAQRVCQPALVRGMPEREQQRDGDGFGDGLPRADGGHNPSDFGIGEGDDGAIGSHPFDRPDHVRALHERRGVIASEIVQRRPVLTPQPEQVLEARGRDERDAGAPAFEQGVRRDGRAVHQNVNGDPTRQRVHRPEESDRRIRGRARHLADLEAPVRRDRDEIGKRPADVHADPHDGGAWCVVSGAWEGLDCQRFTTSTAARPRVASTHSVPTQSPQRT